MKKVFLIVNSIILTLMLCGCGVDYNIEYKDLSFHEDIRFKFENNSDNKKTIDYIKENDFFVKYSYNTDNYYKKSITENDKYYYANFTKSYYKVGLKNSRVFSECFPTYSVVEDDTNIIISTGTGFNCWDYEYNFTDYININLKTDYIVLQHNADEVNGNIYTWHITEDNLDEFKILAVISNKVNVNSAEFIAKDFMSGQFWLIGVLVSLIIIVVVTIFVFKKISDSKNKI